MNLFVFFQFMLLVNLVLTFSNFLSESTLNDGVHRVQIHLKNLRIEQIVAGPSEGFDRGIVLRQASNNRMVVSLVYNGVPSYLRQIERYVEDPNEIEPSLIGIDDEGLALRDCRVEKDKSQVHDFMRKFDNDSLAAQDASTFDLSSSGTMDSSFVAIHKSEDNLPEYLKPLLEFKQLKTSCFQLRRKIRKLTPKKVDTQDSGTSSNHKRRSRRGMHELFIMPGTKWCGNGRLARSYSDLDGYNVVDHCCRVHDLCPTSIPRLTRKYGLYNYYLTTLSHCSCDKRQRRGVTNILSIPHTKWCGSGYSAKSYSELGGLHGADGCCRQHDLHCPFFIQSFERKYGYFNFGLGTLSHCSCDRRFKTCLKQTGTGASDVVGNVFFNIVKSHCFVFKRKKVCKKRGFWSCLKWGYEKQAVVREPIRWNW